MALQKVAWLTRKQSIVVRLFKVPWNYMLIFLFFTYFVILKMYFKYAKFVQQSNDSWSVFEFRYSFAFSNQAKSWSSQFLRTQKMPSFLQSCMSSMYWQQWTQNLHMTCPSGFIQILKNIVETASPCGHHNRDPKGWTLPLHALRSEIGPCGRTGTTKNRTSMS